MHCDVSEYAEADARLLAVNISDDELERAAASDRPQAVNTAFCTQMVDLPGKRWRSGPACGVAKVTTQKRPSLSTGARNSKLRLC